MPPSAACLAKKGKRGPGGCRSLSRVNSGAALLTLRCRTLSLAVELHHVQRDTRLAEFLGEVHLAACPFANHRFDRLEGEQAIVADERGLRAPASVDPDQVDLHAPFFRTRLGNRIAAFAARKRVVLETRGS